MGLRISTNMASVSAQRSLARSGENQKKEYQQLATGNRIITAGDDAAGLSISENLRATIRSTAQAERNAQDGVSFVQVAEGGMQEIGNILIRVRELSIQAASDTVGDREREFINEEFTELVKEVDRIANVTTFNGTPLLNGASDKDVLEFQVGIRNNEADVIGFAVNENNIQTDSLGIDDLNALTIADARESLDKIDVALNKVNSSRARLGAVQNKLHSTVRSLAIAKENQEEARSRIADADVAAVTSNLVRDNILQSAGISVLAQANSSSAQALKLL